jgi:16S rRNA (cytosine1402-N4)-methyltransferase
MFRHEPVLLKEVFEVFSRLREGSLIVDCTLGGGGHSKEMLRHGFRVIGIDRDSEAIEAAKENLKGFEEISFVNDNFVNLKEILSRLRVEAVDGILMDLGVSTYQLEEEERGFGFEGLLDMRMDRRQELTAEKVVNEYSEQELSRILFDYGERRFAGKIAKSIVEYRAGKRIERAEELLEIVEQSMPARYRFSREHHWATPTFRALRMEVNRDMENLRVFLDLFLDCLSKDGMLAIISFHSIEDRIVKHELRELAKEGRIELLNKKPTIASKEETTRNPKSKRAKLRAVKKL